MGILLPVLAGGEGDGQREEDPPAAVCDWNVPPACRGLRRAHWCVAVLRLGREGDGGHAWLWLLGPSVRVPIPVG